jgi:pilus assembly protein CpaC
VIRFLVCFLCALAPVFSVAAVKGVLPTDLEMFAGEAKVFPIDVSRIAIGNGSVISVTTMDNKQLLVIAEKEGSSTLHLWLKDGSEQVSTFNVIDSSMKKKLDDINKLLTHVDNVTARIAGNKIVLEGDMVSDANQERVKAIADMYKEVVNFVGKVGWEKMIYLEFKVLELTNKGSSSLGIAWDSKINGPAAGVIADPIGNSLFRYTPDPGTTGVSLGENFPLKVWPPKGFVSMASVITSKINVLVQDGEATMLAAPNLTTRSGSTAKFIAGGEIPLPVIGTFGQATVEFKEYGIIAEVTPVADSSGVIYAKVDVEVSSIDRSVTIRDIPGLLKRKTTAEFNAREGETVVLNGLYSYQTSKDTQKVPLLGDVPLLGGLFRNKNDDKQTREVAIIITPRLITPTPARVPGPKDLNSENLYQFDKKLRDNAPMPNLPAKLTVTD